MMEIRQCRIGVELGPNDADERIGLAEGDIVTGRELR